MTGTLFVLGIALMAAACIGGGLKVSNVVEIPVISTRVGGIGLAAVGALAIGLGVLTHIWKAQQPQASAPAPSASSSPETEISAASTTGAPAATTSAPNPSADPTVFYVGSVTFDAGGLDLDLAPPRHVDNASIVSLQEGELYTSSSDVTIVTWDDQHVPDKAACSKRLKKAGTYDVEGLSEGSVVCAKTARGRIARITVQSTSSPRGLRATATVWKN